MSTAKQLVLSTTSPNLLDTFSSSPIDSPKLYPVLSELTLNGEPCMICLLKAPFST